MSQPVDGAEVVVFPKVFPALQCDWQVAVFPQKVVKRSQAEVVALSQLGIGEKMQYLTLPDLIADGLPGIGGKKSRFAPPPISCPWARVGQGSRRPAQLVKDPSASFTSTSTRKARKRMKL